MKRRILLSAALVALAVWALAQGTASAPSLARFVPPDPLLLLEARDFGALVRDWNASPVKQAWLASDAFEVFSRSRLYERLSGVANEFAAAAGLPPDMALVDSAAGGESALALYDIGNLHFLYITKLPSARVLESALWKLRSSYETRDSAGQPFFLRADPASRRVAAFATSGDYFLLATREDLMAGALALMAGRGGATVREERWYAEAVKAASAPGELRLVLNLPPLTQSPYFSSYWIQRNVTEMRGYGAGIVDFERGASEYREDRVLLRFGQAPEAKNADLGAALHLVPDGAGLYRASAGPTPDSALVLLREKILAPAAGRGPASKFAPPEQSAGIAGTESDLETRIDEPPPPSTKVDPISPELRKLMEAAGLEAMLEVGATRTLGGVFVAIDSAVVLLARSNWDADAVKKALSGAAESGPLGRIAVEARGGVLIVANAAPLATKIAARLGGPAPSSATRSYAAGFNHAAERARFLSLMRLLDSAPGRRPPAGDARTPQFFSDTLGSLSTTLARVSSETIVRNDTGPAVLETVTYKLQP